MKVVFATVAAITALMSDLVKSDAVNAVKFFPGINGDASKILWSHGTNSKNALNDVVNDPHIMMIEGDISFGSLIGSEGPKIPIMAHPPDVVSDLSYADWLEEIISANSKGQRKGAKLDFKDLEAVRPALELLKRRYDSVRFPVWINADIVPGPVEPSKTPIDADIFLSICKEFFPEATLSLGWTTKYTSINDPRAEFTMEMMQEMEEIIRRNDLDQPITFPIRAAFVPKSIKSIEYLVNTVPESSVTIWSSPTDVIDAEALNILRNELDSDLMYVDLPYDQMKAFLSSKNKLSNAANCHVCLHGVLLGSSICAFLVSLIVAYLWKY